jgi:integrase
MVRTPHGSIAICTQGGRLRLQFPRRWYGGKQKYQTLHLPDTKDNRLYAENLARKMELDHLQNQFDFSLSKYTPQAQAVTTVISLEALWRGYCLYKSRSLKAASIYYLTNTLGVHICRCPHQGIDQALEVREWLLTATTPDMTRRVIQSLATAVKWGVKHQLITSSNNPFVGMAEDIRVEREDPKPNALNLKEKQLVIAAFECNKYYGFYASLVKFWFLTGCRPSEAIGLHWEQIAADCSQIRFDRSIVYIAGKLTHNHKSKTNRARWFPCNPELRDFLIDLREQKHHSSLVFPSRSDRPIEYNNFSSRAWSRIVDPILNRNSTPYSCRDTFITEQIAKGAPIAIIAKWVDNSTKMIERYYLDPSAIDQLKPFV